MTIATLSDDQICDLARDYGRQLPPVRRVMVTLRPRICPFGSLLATVDEARSLLDIGYGSGLFLFLAHAIRPRDRLTGVEVGPALASSARALLDHCDSNRVRVTIDAAAHPSSWPRELFEAVTIRDVLHHVPPPAKHRFVAAAAARVAPGGRLIYKDIDPAPTWRRAMNTLHNWIVAGERVTYTPRERVAGWMRQAGLSRVEAKTTDTLWYRHTLDVFARAPASA